MMGPHHTQPPDAVSLHLPTWLVCIIDMPEQGGGLRVGHRHHTDPRGLAVGAFALRRGQGDDTANPFVESTTETRI
jgi:hypothetical protein